MKTQWKKHWNRCWCSLLSFSLTLLGFSSCNLEDPEDDPVICMYGTPTAYYAVKGKVVDTKGKPLAGIQVTVPRFHYSFVQRTGVILEQPQGTRILNDTVRIDNQFQQTGSEGTFEWYVSEFPYDTLRADLKFTDVDGLPPHVLTDSVQITFLRKELKNGDGDWDEGKVEKKITVTLKKEDEQ